MARARNIKPSLFKNEILGAEDPLLTILFIGLWCLADRDGRLEDRPLRIKAELLPYRDNLDINRYLTVLERLDFIHRYKVGEIAVIQVLTFTEHQNPHHTEKPSVLPAFSTTCELTVNSPLDNGYTPADSGFLIPDSGSLIPDSLNTDSLNTDSTTNLNPADFDYPIRDLVEAFPSMELTPAAVGFIDAAVKPDDKIPWQRTIRKYQMNFNPLKRSYLPEKTANLLGVFEDEKRKYEQERNGTNSKTTKRTDADVFAESAEFYANYEQ